MTIVVKTRTDPLALVAAVRSEIRKLDAQLPAAQVRTMDEVVASSVSDRRLNLTLIGPFAALALLLAMVGLWWLPHSIDDHDARRSFIILLGKVTALNDRELRHLKLVGSYGIAVQPMPILAKRPDL